MGHLSTHVLDTMHGRPGAGMQVTLLRLDEDRVTVLRSCTLDADGRSPGGPLLEGAQFQPGRYRLAFAVAAYFDAQGVQLPDPPFLDVVNIDFGVADSAARYHVPLLVSPWAYSSYRGS